MRLDKEDIKAIQDVTSFLEQFYEPEGFFLSVSLKNEDMDKVGSWEYEEDHWVFVIGDA